MAFANGTKGYIIKNYFLMHGLGHPLKCVVRAIRHSFAIIHLSNLTDTKIES